jgi:drug/metabolite transporter (DMT)-like permease
MVHASPYAHDDGMAVPAHVPWRSLSGSIASSTIASGTLYALAAGVALGTLGPVSNIAYGAGMGSATFAALRATIGAFVLILLVRRHDDDRVALRTLPRAELAMLALVALAQALLSLALFAAYKAMAVALVLAVYFCYPLLVAGLSIVLGRERLTPARAFALSLAIAGLLAVVLGRAADAEASVPGLLLALAAASCQAVYLVASRRGFTRVPSHQAVGCILAGAAGMIWLVALPTDGAAGHLVAWIGHPEAWLAILVAGTLGAALAKTWMMRGVRRLGGTRSAVLMLTEPVTGVLLAAVLIGQLPTPIQAAGIAGVLVGALVAQRPAPGREPRPAQGRPPANRNGTGGW